MKKIILILSILFLTCNSYPQIQSIRKGNITTNNITNNISDIGWQRSGSNVFQFNNGDLVGIGVSSPSSDLHIQSSAGVGPAITLENNGDGVLALPWINFINNDPTPTDGSGLSIIQMQGKDDLGNTQSFASITSLLEDASDAVEAAGMDFRILINGVAKSALFLDGYNGTPGEGDIVINEESVDFNFRVESDNKASALFVEGSSGYLGVGTSAPAENLHIVDTNTGTPGVKIETLADGSIGPDIFFYLNSATPADNDFLGDVSFKGNDNTAAEAEYAFIRGVSKDVTNTTEAGEIVHYVTINGSLREFLSLNGYNGVAGQGDIVFNEEAQDLDFRIETSADVNSLFIQGLSGDIGMGTGAPENELHIQRTGGSIPVLHLESINGGSNGPELRFELDDIGPNDGDRLGYISYRGDNSTGGSEIYAFVRGRIGDVTANDEAGRVEFQVQMDGLFRNILDLKGYNGVVNQGEVTINEDGQDVDLRVESDTKSSALFVQGSSGNVGLGTSSPGNSLVVSGTPGIIETTQLGVTLGAGVTTFAATSNVMVIDGDAGGNTIATITGFNVGGLLTLIFVDGSVTITDDNSHAANTVDLSAAFTSADDKVLQLVYDGTSWYQVAPVSAN